MVALEQGHVLQQQANHSFPFPVGGGRFLPEAGEVSGQGKDLGPFLFVEEQSLGLSLAFVLLLGGDQCA